MNNTFDWLGYSKEKLLSLAEPTKKERIKQSKYPVVDFYGSGVFLRKYAYYPYFLELCCYSSHSIHYYGELEEHELDNEAPFMLLYDKNRLKKYQKTSTKPAYKVPAPLPWLRKKYGISQLKEAKGTLAFFTHTTPEVGYEEPIEKVAHNYIDELCTLPQEMFPICVCLHVHDITNGAYKYFLNRNIPVYTAGHYFSKKFALNFYNLMKNFKWTTGTAVGSNAWYSIEMGIPYFNYGTFKELTYNETLYDSFKNEQWLYVQKQFEKVTDTVTNHQKQMAITLLGLDEGNIGHKELSILLYKAFIQHKLKKRSQFLYKFFDCANWNF